MLFSFYQCILLPPSSRHVFNCYSFHFSLSFLLLHPSFHPLFIVSFTILFFALFTFPSIPSVILLSPLPSPFRCSSVNQFFLHSFLLILLSLISPFLSTYNVICSSSLHSIFLHLFFVFLSPFFSTLLHPFSDPWLCNEFAPPPAHYSAKWTCRPT